jgi:hypothetical protein
MRRGVGTRHGVGGCGSRKDMVSGEAYTNDMKKVGYERGERKKDISNGKKLKEDEDG